MLTIDKAPKAVRIWFPLYALERLNDPGLRACSRPARSFYSDLECYVYLHGEPKGFLTLPNGAPILMPTEIARQIPGDSVKDTTRWLDELRNNGVIARAESGVISLPLLQAIFEKQDAAAERKRKSLTKKTAGGLHD